MKHSKTYIVIIYVLNIIFAFIVLVPILYCFNVSMMDMKEIYAGKFFPSGVSLENYIKALDLAPLFTFIKNSLVTSLIITAAQIVTGALAAYAFSMMRFKGKNLLFMLMLATMMIPSQAIIIANYLTVAGWGLRDSYLALVLPNLAAAFAVFNMRQAFMQLPTEIKEAAEIDGVLILNFSTGWRCRLLNRTSAHLVFMYLYRAGTTICGLCSLQTVLR